MMLVEFIIKLNIKTMEEGRALWGIIANKEVYMDDIHIITGSFRWNASAISHVCGGNYMDYYCSSGQEKEKNKIIEKFINLNVSIKPIKS
jgi:hypothetical protein